MSLVKTKDNNMSINRNRAKLKKANNGKEYGDILFNELNPPYSEEGWNWKTSISNKNRRSYRTWKHNRNRQYKDEF